MPKLRKTGIRAQRMRGFIAVEFTGWLVAGVLTIKRPGFKGTLEWRATRDA